jgi:hypothetical protein
LLVLDFKHFYFAVKLYKMRQMPSFTQDKNPGTTSPTRTLSIKHPKKQTFMRKRLMSVKSIAVVLTAMVLQLSTAFGQVATLQNWTSIYHGTASHRWSSLLVPTELIQQGACCEQNLEPHQAP